jgi:acyl carrier protein
MLTRSEISTAVENRIREILLDDLDDLDDFDQPPATGISGTEELMALGMNSLMLARLIIQLASEFGIDPFAEEIASLADVRVVDDLVTAYERALLGLAGQQA